MAKLNGYINIYMPNHPLATTNGMVYEHVLVAEQKIGRPLKKGETVHHIDHSRDNNSPENLLVFASNAEHAAFHKGIEYYLDSEGIAHCDAKQIKTCVKCGQPITKKATFCKECARIES